MVMSARNAWMNSASSQEANDAWEKNLNVSAQDKSNDHRHRREGKLSQSEIDRMVEEAENYREEDESWSHEPNKSNIATKLTKLSKPSCAKCWRRPRSEVLEKIQELRRTVRMTPS